MRRRRCSPALLVGDQRVNGFDEKAYVAALEAAGYPEKADPAQKQRWKIILEIAVMVAFLVSLFFLPETKDRDIHHTE
jgi:hypothetical protein